MQAQPSSFPAGKSLAWCLASWATSTALAGVAHRGLWSLVHPPPSFVAMSSQSHASVLCSQRCWQVLPPDSGPVPLTCAAARLPAPHLLPGWLCRILYGASLVPSSYLHTMVELMSHFSEHRPHTQSSCLEYFGGAFLYIDFSLLDGAPEKQKPWLIHLCLSPESLFHTLPRWWPWQIP